MNSLLQPVIGHTLDPRTGEYRQNADEEAFDRRTERGFAGMARRYVIAHQEPPSREPRLGPATWTITAPAEAVGETFADWTQLGNRLLELSEAGHRIIILALGWGGMFIVAAAEVWRNRK